jgi:hypothetical protein
VRAFWSRDALLGGDDDHELERGREQHEDGGGSSKNSGGDSAIYAAAGYQGRNVTYQFHLILSTPHVVLLALGSDRATRP